MQSAARLRLCLFSFDNEQNNDDYQDKKSLLERCGRSCTSALKNFKCNDRLVIAHIPYDTRNDIHLSIIGYKGHVFYGFFNTETGKISFEDNNNQVINLKSKYIDKLEERFVNEINNPTHIKDDGIQSAWNEVLPLLDKCIEYDKALENIPEKIRNRMLQQYDEQLNTFIEAYENDNLEHVEISIVDASL